MRVRKKLTMMILSAGLVICLGCSKTVTGFIDNQSVNLVSDHSEDFVEEFDEETGLEEVANETLEETSDEEAIKLDGDHTKSLVFKPAYPDRRDPFRQPEFKELTSAQMDDDSAEDQIVLKGFLNIQVPKALIAINGEIAAMRVGDEREGVRVIQVASPQVTLQRGRIRWTVSLLDAS